MIMRPRCLSLGLFGFLLAIALIGVQVLADNEENVRADQAHVLLRIPEELGLHSALVEEIEGMANRRDLAKVAQALVDSHSDYVLITLIEVGLTYFPHEPMGHEEDDADPFNLNMLEEVEGHRTARELVESLVERRRIRYTGIMIASDADTVTLFSQSQQPADAVRQSHDPAPIDGFQVTRRRSDRNGPTVTAQRIRDLAERYFDDDTTVKITPGRPSHDAATIVVVTVAHGQDHRIYSGVNWISLEHDELRPEYRELRRDVADIIDTFAQVADDRSR